MLKLESPQRLGPASFSNAAGKVRGRTWLEMAADYVDLTKPRITILNMITVWAALWLAAGGRPAWQLTVPALTGAALAVASGATLNCWVERDRDRLMARTRDRPLPAGRLQPNNALIFGLVLGALGVAILAWGANWAAAAVAFFGIVFYAGIYTALLKGSTHWNTVLGSIAGAVPPIIGWVAATGTINLAGLAVAGLVFAWQPVHFWALALRYAEDYRRAGIKMLPVTHGNAKTRRHILLWTLILLATSISVYVLDVAGVYYVTAAAVCGAGLLALALRNLRDSGMRTATTLFHSSNAYLALLYVLLVVDAVY